MMLILAQPPGEACLLDCGNSHVSKFMCGMGCVGGVGTIVQPLYSPSFCFSVCIEARTDLFCFAVKDFTVYSPAIEPPESLPVQPGDTLGVRQVDGVSVVRLYLAEGLHRHFAWKVFSSK